MFCSKTCFSKTSYHIETNEMIFKANELTGFYMKRVCAEKYFRITYIHRKMMFISLELF